MKKGIKILLISLSVFFILCLAGLSILFSIYYNIAKTVKFDKSKFINAELFIEVFNQEEELISDKNQFNNKYIKISDINQQTIDAFISIEDKNFYSHHGVNYKRMVKALAKNISSRKFKEGASTISQQLIKNTHLSNEKTIKRKLKEISLAKKMEQELTKNEILENYLNVIYFGNNIYGIEDASHFYFSKSAKELNLNESAILAGMICSPGNYCPITKSQNCIKRRNLVLNQMYADGKISAQMLETNKTLPLSLKIDKDFDNGQNSYSQASIDQACKILSLPTKQIALGGYKIYTFQNPKKQLSLENSIKSCATEFDKNDVAGISINNRTCAIEAFYGKSSYSILSANRQPGSIIKPILVYGPAMNENIISPATRILDDEIDINGYSPQNATKNYSGYVSVRQAIAQSINIPAVKTLSYVGIEKAKKYASRFNIQFDEKDNGYALALGGMTQGTNLQVLSTAYASFANNGKFKESSFVKKICDKNGKVIFEFKNTSDQIFREDANYLTLSSLISSVQEGTAKKLKSLPYQIASKTGTVGKGLKNTDAYNISLTTEDTVGVWIGNMSAGANIGIISGGNQPTSIVKTYFQKIYSTQKPTDFKMPSSVEEIEIDSIELEKNKVVVKANDFMPKRFKTKEIFSRFNAPKSHSNNFIEIKPTEITGKISGNNAIIEFEAEKYYIYELYKVNNNKKKQLIKSYSEIEGKISHCEPINKNSKVKFYLITKIKNHATGEELESDKSNLIELITSKKMTTNPAKDKWYI